MLLLLLLFRLFLVLKLMLKTGILLTNLFDFYLVQSLLLRFSLLQMLQKCLFFCNCTLQLTSFLVQLLLLFLSFLEALLGQYLLIQSLLNFKLLESQLVELIFKVSSLIFLFIQHLDDRIKLSFVNSWRCASFRALDKKKVTDLGLSTNVSEFL